MVGTGEKFSGFFRTLCVACLLQVFCVGVILVSQQSLCDLGVILVSQQSLCDLGLMLFLPLHILLPSYVAFLLND